MTERSDLKLSLRRQCWLLSVSRAGLSYKPVTADNQTLQIMRRLDEWYVEHPDLGHRRLVVLLKQEGWPINIKRVRRLRALMGLEAQFPKPNLSKPGMPRQRFFYLLRGLVIHSVDQVWATDITATADRVYSHAQRLFLCDGYFLHSRYVLHWELSNTAPADRLEADWCVGALQKSLQKWGKPEIFNRAGGPDGSGKPVYQR